MKKNQTYKNLNYDFSDYAEEITGNALFEINGGAEVENSHEGVAGANVGDTITRKNGEVIVLKQADIDYAQQQLGDAGNASGSSKSGNNNQGTSGTSSTSNNNNSDLNEDSAPAYSQSNYDSYAYYMSMQGRAKDEGNPDKYKGYNVRGGKQIKGNEVYFIYVYKTNNQEDQKKKAYERNSINEEVGYLIQNNISVKVIENGKFSDIKNALEDKQIKLLVTSGHGSDVGYIETANGQSFGPSHLKNINVSNSLETVIFENCYQRGKTLFSNENERKWEEAFGGKVNVIGWGWQTFTSETVRFNNSGLFDRQIFNLMHYCKGIVNEKK